jgi:glycerophosphoryl diester phosphodiesterase
MRKLRLLAVLIAALALGVAALQFLPPRGVVPGKNLFRARDGGRPLIIAHGGSLGLYPENTLEAFAGSAALGCDVLEMDLRLTREGVLVTHHDAGIERTSDGRGLVIDQTLAQLKAWNFGHHFQDASGAHPYRQKAARIAALEEVFQRSSPMPMVLELKDREAAGTRAAAKLASLLERYHLESWVLVACFDDATLAQFRRASRGRVLTSTARRTTTAYVLLDRLWLDWLAPAGAAALQMPVAHSGLRLDRPGLVRAAHRRNMAVHYWTVNEPDEMRRLIRLGADGLITDRPDRLKAVLKELGYSS